MSDIALTQAEADALINMPKIRTSTDLWDYPPLGGSISIPIISFSI